MSQSQTENFKKAVQLYGQFQGIDDGVFTEEDFHDFMGFLSFDHDSFEEFKHYLIRPFYEEDKKSVSSQRSNRSRDFQNKSQIREDIRHSYEGDFRKNKDSPIAYSPKEKSENNFSEFQE